MSEVIVRMEMPTGCANCQMADDDSRFCKAAKEYIPMLGKPSWCPIVGELPEQHGDLIDRDALLKDCYPDDEFDAHVIYADDIREAKAIIAAERSETNGNAD